MIDTTYALAGRSISRLGYGAMRLCGQGVFGPPADESNALAVLRRAIELGVQFVDTSDAYGPEVSERQIDEALAPYADDVVIATKGGLERPGPSRWTPNGAPANLRAACEGSLQRLGVEAIDLYQLHAVDERVPLEESVGTLAALKTEGKIRHVGLSNVDADELARARTIVEIASVQNRYNIGARDDDALIDLCAREGIAFLPYFPIEAGDLAKARGPLANVARAHGATTAQIALAWLLHRAPNVVPIPGTSSLAHLEENVAAREIELAPAELRSLEAA